MKHYSVSVSLGLFFNLQLEEGQDPDEVVESLMDNLVNRNKYIQNHKTKILYINEVPSKKLPRKSKK